MSFKFITNLLMIKVFTFGFHKNRKKMMSPCRQFKMSVRKKIIENSLKPKDIDSITQVTPITMKSRRYKKNLFYEKNCYNIEFSIEILKYFTFLDQHRFSNASDFHPFEQLTFPSVLEKFCMQLWCTK